MDLLLMGLLVFAGAGGGYAAGRRGRRGARRVAAEAALETHFVALSEGLASHREQLQERCGAIEAALGRHAVNSQELRDGLEAVKGDLDRRLHLFDVDLGTVTRRLDEMGAAVNVQWAQQLQELRTLLEEEGERVKELAVEQRVQGSDVQELKERSVDRHRELDRLAAVVQRLEHAAESVSGNASRLEALEMAQGLNDGRLAHLEHRLTEAAGHMANLAQDTLAAIGELKSELAGELETMGDRVEKVDADQQQLLELLERRLGEVQDFIIKAADDAKARREGLQSGPPPGAVMADQPPTMPVGGVAELLAQQRALQQVFRQRRPGDGGGFAVVPRGVGL